MSWCHSEFAGAPAPIRPTNTEPTAPLEYTVRRPVEVVIQTCACCLFAEVRGLCFLLVVGDELIRARTADFGPLAFIEERCRAIAGTPSDQSRSVGFCHRGIFIRAIECPVNCIGRNTMEVALLTQVALILDEKPDLAVEDIIDLLRFVLVRFGVIPGLSGCDHEAAFVAIAFAYDHLTGPGLPGLSAVVFGNFVRLAV